MKRDASDIRHAVPSTRMVRVMPFLTILLVGLMMIAGPTLTGASAEEVRTRGHKKPVIFEEVRKKVSREPMTRVLVKVRDAAGATALQDELKYMDRKERQSRRKLVGRIHEKAVQGMSGTIGKGEFAIERSMANIPWVDAWVSARGLEELENNPDVEVIVDDQPVSAFLAQSGPVINAPEVHLAGFTGQDINVAVLDTGIDTDHPHLSDSLVHEECFLSGGGCPGGGGVRRSGPGSAEDGQGHGTHVAGIITSSHDTHKGIAPDAGIVAIKVLSDAGSGSFSDIVAAIDWAATNAETYGIRVINMSLGGGQYADVCDNSMPPLRDAANAAKAAGITIFAASGNNYWVGAISAPACISSINAVGAVFDATMADPFCGGTATADSVACFSNVSAKVDMLAPGYLITSTYRGGGQASMGGTSMASPHAAAVAAVLLSKSTDLTPDEVSGIMKQSGTPVTDPWFEADFPRVDLEAAIHASPDEGSPAVQFSLTFSSGAESTSAAFTVRLSSSSDQAVTVNVATASGTASSESDFEGVLSTLTFNPGETTRTITVPVIDDMTTELPETFTVTLSSPVNAHLGPARLHTYTILDNDDPRMSFSISSSSGMESATSVALTVNLTFASSQTITVNYATSNGTAVAGSDYVARSGILTFPAGVTSRTIPLSIINDARSEASETFVVTLSDPVNATLDPMEPPTHTRTIWDNDPLPLVQFGATSSSGGEGITTVTIPVKLSATSGRTVTVDYATSNGTAVAGSDYVARSGTLAFAPGVTTQLVTVTLTNDAIRESNETFRTTLSSPSGAALGTRKTHTRTIANND